MRHKALNEAAIKYIKSPTDKHMNQLLKLCIDPIDAILKIIKYTKNVSDTADLRSHLLERTWKRIPYFDSTKSSFYTFLHVNLRNSINNWLKQSGSERNKVLSTAAPIDGNFNMKNNDFAFNALMAKSTIEELKRRLQSDPVALEIIELLLKGDGWSIYKDGISTNVIAERFGVPAGRIQHKLKIIKKTLQRITKIEERGEVNQVEYNRRRRSMTPEEFQNNLKVLLNEKMLYKKAGNFDKARVIQIEIDFLQSDYFKYLVKRNVDRNNFEPDNF